MTHPNHEPDLSFESFSAPLHPGPPSFSASTASFPHHQLSFSLSIHYSSQSSPHHHPSNLSRHTQDLSFPQNDLSVNSNSLQDESSFGQGAIIIQEEEEQSQIQFDGYCWDESDHSHLESDNSSGFHLDPFDSNSSSGQQRVDSPFFPEPEQAMGMTGDEIRDLPTMTWGAMHERFNGGQKCSVCLEEYKVGNVLRVMGCLHRFHSECLDEWLAAKATCPNCRTEVDRQ